MNNKTKQKKTISIDLHNELIEMLEIELKWLKHIKPDFKSRMSISCTIGLDKGIKDIERLLNKTKDNL